MRNGSTPQRKATHVAPHPHIASHPWHVCSGTRLVPLCGAVYHTCTYQGSRPYADTVCGSLRFPTRLSGWTASVAATRLRRVYAPHACNHLSACMRHRANHNRRRSPEGKCAAPTKASAEGAQCVARQQGRRWSKRGVTPVSDRDDLVQQLSERDTTCITNRYAERPELAASRSHGGRSAAQTQAQA